MACLEEVHIAELAHQRADQLSGGQAQRVAIARVLAQRPAAILADEPVASLDPRSSEIVLNTLDKINRTRGVPIVMNLHHVDIAQRHADRIVGLRSGRLVLDTTPARLSAHNLSGLYGESTQPHASILPSPMMQAQEQSA
jgi:phosphonate transport system ATP-binding protein